ncbi:conserved exported hypothetical protein [[Clostridium] ultunense Esp]|uniref:hypothetical protein n=1 Tax=Thermicanus aegyptius TaxID=94009 RepID=UPI0002B6FCE3|nr:hypothetical protein [Thermicanus aegyptius]CCQ96609.1 conserved exported hypothetical protein [[Clostridium] ultunense Esp]
MAFRTRNRLSLLSKVLGILLAVGGVTILLTTLPVWVWFLLLGMGMIAGGWYLYFYR